MVGTVCPGTTACVSGVCGSTVPDNNNCGLNPTVVCPAGQTCISSVCTPAAEPVRIYLPSSSPIAIFDLLILFFRQACGTTGAPCGTGLTCTTTGLDRQCVNLATDVRLSSFLPHFSSIFSPFPCIFADDAVSQRTNCGRLSNICPGTTRCIARICTAASPGPSQRAVRRNRKPPSWF